MPNPDWLWGGATGVSGEPSMKAMLAAGRPLYVTMDVHRNFMQINSGEVFLELTGSKVGGHAMSALGYGTDGGVDYWLIQNSWGPSGWGEGGFGKLKRGINMGGIETVAMAIRAWNRDGPAAPDCQDDSDGSGLIANGGQPVSCAAAVGYGLCNHATYGEQTKMKCPVACGSCTTLGYKGEETLGQLVNTLIPPPTPAPTPAPPLPPTPAPMPPAVLDEAVVAGATSLTLTDVFGFNHGSKILVGKGSDSEESNEVTSTEFTFPDVAAASLNTSRPLAGKLTLENPVANSHSAGDEVALEDAGEDDAVHQIY